jgi:Tfp pilus assembly protein PilO
MRLRRKQGFLINTWLRMIEHASNVGPIRTAITSSLLAIVFAVVIYMLMLSPLEELKKTETQELQTIEKNNVEANRIRETKEGFLEDFKHAVAFYEAARQQLPEDQEVSSALAEIRDMAVNDGVKIISFEASKPEGKTKVDGKVYAQHVPAVVSGTHSAVTKFLVKLSKYNRIVHINKFEFKSIKKKETLEMQLSTFSVPSPDELPPIPNEIKTVEAVKLY